MPRHNFYQITKPGVLLLFITNECNYKCKTCLREYGRGLNLPLRILKKSLPQACKLGYNIVSLTGGEPAMHPDFEKIVDMIVENGMRFAVISNGTFLDTYLSVAGRYGKYFKAIDFSLDGSNSKINDFIRGEGSFSQVKRSVKSFLNQDIKVGISVCLNTYNTEYIEDIIKLSVLWGAKTIKFSGISRTHYNSKLVLSDQKKADCMEQINKYSKKYPQIRMFVSPSLQTYSGIFYCQLLNNMETLAVNPKGELIFCCETVRLGVSLGSLDKHPFKELYEKYIDTASSIRKIRLNLLLQGKTMKGFNSCEFCNSILPAAS